MTHKQNIGGAGDFREHLACDVSELIGRLRRPIKHPQQSVSLRLEAADALETLAGENEKLRDAVEIPRMALINQRNAARARELDAESRLAKLAPVVEAARGIKRAEEAKDQGEWVKCHDIMYRALATLEAAHD